MAWEEEKKSEAIEQILKRIREGESVRSILEYANRDILPSFSTFLEWVAKDKDLSEQYARAMEVRAAGIFDEIITIADESNADIDITDDGKLRVNGEAVSRSRLKIDARKWVLGKMNPKKYGEKVEIDHQSSDGSMSPTKIVFGSGNQTK